jgi:hypothetical protein
MNLSEAWAALDREHSRAAGMVSRRLDSAAPCGLLAAVEQPGSVRALLIEVPMEAIGPEQWARGRGFEVHPIMLGGGDRGRVQLQIRCADRTWEDVFMALTIDLVSRLERADSPVDAVAALRRRLAIWQAFFQRDNPAGLTPEEQRGLLGELWCMRHVLFDAWSPSAAVRAWQGPAGAAQDFIAHVAVEVKASLVDGPPWLRIANAQQLDQPAGLELILLHVAIAAHEGGQVALPSLVEDVVATLTERAPGSLEEFFARLQTAGYLMAEAELYVNRFSVQAEAFYRVVDGFPRIIDSDLHPGVVSVEYAIGTAAIQPFRLELAAARQLLGAG